MRVLIGFDGSSTARAAAAEMLRFPWPSGMLARAIVASGGIAGPLALRKAGRAALLGYAAWIERRLRARWPTARAALSTEPPATALLAESARMRADLVVVGWRGHGPIRRLLMGSVSREIAREAKTAVMVVRARRRRTAQASRFVLGYDGSRNARRALQFLARLQPPAGARVLVLSALPPLYAPPLSLNVQASRLAAIDRIRRAERARENRARARMDRAAEVLRRRGWSVQTRFTAHAPLLSLLDAAAAFEADALVVGARGIGGPQRVLLGSVANGALERSRCPVILVR